MHKMLIKYIYGAHLYFIFGIFIGITLCLIFSYTDCDFEKNYGFNSNEKTDDEYEPVINLAGKPMKAHKTPQSIIRPRYYSTELGIRSKLFVGVLTNKRNILRNGISFNRTVGHLVDKLMFFIESTGSEKLNISLPGVVGFTDTRTILKPFHTLKYISDIFLEDYDYFFLISDVSYLNARKLKNVVNKISISQNVHLGSTIKDNSIYCSLDAGLLLSNSIMNKLKYNLDWCVKHAYSDSDSDNLGRCILHSTELPCKNSIQGQRFESFSINSEILFENKLKTLAPQTIINSLSFYPLHNPTLFYKVHLIVSQSYINEKEIHIKDLRESIKKENKKTPNPNEFLKWPIGNRPSVRPGNRFDVIRWDYFTDKYIYLSDDFSTIKELEGSEKIDIQLILNASIENVYSKSKNKLSFLKLLNGYKRFDPARGMEYKLDLSFRDKVNGLEIHKRIEICKPLGKVELIAMPYVTENTRVNIILPITSNHIEEAKMFIYNYSKICMEKHEKTFLILVLTYSNLTPGKGNYDIYNEIKDLANSLSNKHKKDGGKILWVSIKLAEEISEDEPIIDFIVADLGTKKLSPDSLIFLAQVNMEIRLDFLNRVRMNTISKHQVYCPIPFSEFNPDIIYNEEIRPQQLDINKNYGHYVSGYTSIISFYLYDYLTVRKNIENTIPFIQSDREIPLMIKALSKNNYFLQNTLYSLFVRKSNLHILRAVEPGLRLRYLSSNCNIKEEYFQKRCYNFQASNQGTRSQLASIILSYLNNK